MTDLQWYGYLHVNGHVQVKRFFSREDIAEARQSDFVEDVTEPFQANGRNDALEKARDMLK